MLNDVGLTTGDVTEMHCFFTVRSGESDNLRQALQQVGTDDTEPLGIREAAHVVFDDGTRLLLAIRYVTPLVPAESWYSFLRYCDEVPQGRVPLAPEAIMELLQSHQVRASCYLRS